MSNKGLDSKTITKRNVAQSTVIFSVVVAVITISAIVAVAFFDFQEDDKAASKEKTIPEMIAEMKQKSELHRQQAELAAQSEDLVAAVDKRVEDMKQLEKKLQKVEEKLTFVNSQSASPVAVNQSNNSAAPASVGSKQVQTAQPTLSVQQLNNAQKYLDYRKAWNEYQHQQRVHFAHHSNASMEAFYSISLHFRARSSMNTAHDWSGAHKVNGSYNTKASASNNWNAKQL